MWAKVRWIIGIVAVVIIIPTAIACWVHVYHQYQEDEAMTPHVVNGHVVLPKLPDTPKVAAKPVTPPKPRAPKGPTTQQLVDAHQIDDGEQSELTQLLDRQEAITELPAWVKKVVVLPDGRPVFYSSTPNKLSPNNAMRDSVQRFAGKLTSIVRGGRLVLADSHQRFWVAMDNEGPLYCLQNGEWSQPSLKADVPVDADHPKCPPNPNFAGRTGIVAAKEFSDGTCRFLVWSVRDAYRVVTVTADGKSSCEWVGDAEEMDLNTYQAGAKFVEQDHGIITIVPYAVPIPKVFQYDGKAWQTITLPKPGENDIYGVTAVQDGSLLVMSSSRRMSTFWTPAAQVVAQSKINGYISDLDDRAYPKRRGAYVALSLCGEMARKPLEAAQAAGPSPEATLSIQRLLVGLDHQAAPEPANASQYLYAGRYWYGGASVASADWKGRPLLELSSFVDVMKDPSSTGDPTQPKASDDVAFAVLEPNGELNVLRLLSRDEINKADYSDSAGMFFTDRKWQLWSNRGKVFNVDLSLAERRDGMFFTAYDGEDDAGRMIGHVEAKFYVLRPDVAPAKPELEEQVFSVNWVKVTPERDAAIGCSFQDAGARPVPAKTIYRLDQTQADWLTVPLDDAALTTVEPFKQGRVFVVFNPPGTTNGISAGYYDGKKWQFDMNMTTLATRIPKSIAEGAPPVLNDQHNFAGDGQGHFWAHLVAVEPQPDAQQFGVSAYPCDRLLYYDGNKTHDVWADWNRLDGKPVTKPKNDPMHSAPDEGYPDNRDPVRTVLGGKALLVQNQRRETWQLHYEDGKLVVDPITLNGEVLAPQIGPVHPNDRHTSALQGLEFSRTAETSDGSLWFTLDSNRQLARLKDKKVQAFENYGKVFMADSHDHVWVCESSAKNITLAVYQGDVRVPTSLTGIRDVLGMVESPDGRLWMVDQHGLSQLSVTGDGAAMQVTSLHHWAWPITRQAFSPEFADSSGHLWCSTAERSITRVTLPPATNPTTQP